MPELDEFGSVDDFGDGYSDRTNHIISNCNCSDLGDGYGGSGIVGGDKNGYGDGLGNFFTRSGYSDKSEWEGVLCPN